MTRATHIWEISLSAIVSRFCFLPPRTSSLSSGIYPLIWPPLYKYLPTLAPTYPKPFQGYYPTHRLSLFIFAFTFWVPVSSGESTLSLAFLVLTAQTTVSPTCYARPLHGIAFSRSTRLVNSFTIPNRWSIHTHLRLLNL